MPADRSGQQVTRTDHRRAQTHTATSALPYPHLGGWRGLCAQPQLQLATGELPDWANVRPGPAEVTDARGRVWWQYQAEADTRDAGPVGCKATAC